MAWTNLDDVYVSANGGTIAGDLKVNGTLTINDKKGTNTTYDVASQITSLRDSVSPTSFKNKIVFASNEGAAHSYFVICGNMVFIFYQGAGKTHTGGDILFTVPKEYAPNNQIFAVFVKNATAYGSVFVDSSGNCRVSQISSTTVIGRIYFQMCYPLTS